MSVFRVAILFLDVQLIKGKHSSTALVASGVYTGFITFYAHDMDENLFVKVTSSKPCIVSISVSFVKGTTERLNTLIAYIGTGWRVVDHAKLGRHYATIKSRRVNAYVILQLMRMAQLQMPLILLHVHVFFNLMRITSL